MATINKQQLPKQLVAYGLILSSPIQEFSPKRPFTYCRICGKVYQVHNAPEHEALQMRKNWSHAHARTHPDRLHRQLQTSGLWVFPEAAHRLAAFGIVPVIDMVMNNEVEAALRESTPQINDGLEYN